MRSPRSIAKPAVRILAAALVALVLLTACAEDERRGIRLTPTSTVDAGVRVLVDNCPGPASVSLSVRQDVLWEVQRPATPDTNDTSDTVVTPVEPEPGLAEFLVGQTPDGWMVATPLESTLQPGTRYTIRTEPDGQTIDFSTPDLAVGLLWDGRGNAQFNPNLINAECSEPADVGMFAQNILVLVLLGVTAAAAVLVALILVLFVITRRFSRIRSLEKRAAGDSTKPQRPRARSRS